MELPKLNFTVLDTETTGFIPRTNRVIEFASVRVEDGEVVDEYEQLLSIPDDIPETVRVITRIAQDDLEGKSTFDDVRSEIEQHIGEDTIIIGQNVGFDIRMLRGEGIDLSDRPWLDTSMLASLVFPELESYSLGYVSTVLGLRHEPVHRALGDVHATLELLSRCWERLLELPLSTQRELEDVMQRSTPGYQKLFAIMPESKTDALPEWIQKPESISLQKNAEKFVLPKPDVGVVDLVDEPLNADFLQGIIQSCADDAGTVHWIAVKNLTARLKKLDLPESVRVLQPPALLLDMHRVQELESQDLLTSDEATLLLKLRWYEPITYSDAPIHGDENAVWYGKMACTETSTTYLQQFEDLPAVMLLDHKQLLSILADPQHPAYGKLSEQSHIIIDDASMLEDTATKAYGVFCSMDALRAITEGDDELTRFADLLQLWIEKVRNFQDQRFITPNDLNTTEANTLREQLDALLTVEYPPQTLRILQSIHTFLDPDLLKGRIVWIEVRSDGAQFIESVPEHISNLLKETLYDRFPTTLLIPTHSNGTLQEILPPNVETTVNDSFSGLHTPFSMGAPDDVSLERILSDPPAGKTIVLATSRRAIEDIFIRYTEAMEEQGVTLICQNFSGGQSRTQAEFLAADAPAVWVMTPWQFEGIELEPGTIDLLIVATVPFDHPSHAVRSKRAEHYRNAFEEYSLPRLEHRLFRLLRTFKQYATRSSAVLILDKRLKQKAYGKRVLQYLFDCCTVQKQSDHKEAKTFTNADYPENWQMNLFD